MSGRGYFLKMREWELDSMKAFVRELETHMDEVYALWFFYSFQIPRLGKEFDLLQIKDAQIVNIELKSGAVSDETIRKQLIQNRYYLSVLGRPIYSYTYISSQNRLVRLTNHDHISDASWQQLCGLLINKCADYGGEIEDLFQAEMYLISPLTEPLKFLRKEYFLTSQQRDIKRQILKRIRTEHTGYYSFSGLPGTGKTLLLYDMAMKLSVRQQVCLIHCGEAVEQWKVLHERLRRVKYLADSQITSDLLSGASAVLVDEAHLLSQEKLEYLLRYCGKRPVIFSSDYENMLSPEELDRAAVHALEQISGIQSFRLTNRIRTNAEISSFIQNMMCLPERKKGRHFPHVTVLYANDDREADVLLSDAQHQGYQVILNEAEPAICAGRLAMVLDQRYFYDRQNYLRSEDRSVRRLFHQLNGAKEELLLVVKQNEPLYAALLDLL